MSSGYRFYHITQEGELVLVATLAEALAAISKGGLVWLDYSLPTNAIFRNE
jgi:hypothetical protein